MTVSMIGILGPSSVLAYVAGQWAHRNRTRRSVRAFKAGMAPIVVGAPALDRVGAGQCPGRSGTRLARVGVDGGEALVVWRTRLHLLWLLGLGALLGGFGVL